VGKLREAKVVLSEGFGSGLVAASGSAPGRTTSGTRNLRSSGGSGETVEGGGAGEWSVAEGDSGTDDC
jgi:hypothetical protein